VSVTQLLPELAEPVAAARAVIFVDACCDDHLETAHAWELVVEPVSAGQTHYAGPADILRLSRACYGRVPRAWLVSVPSTQFELSDTLSTTARENAEEAARIVGDLIDDAVRIEVAHA
jgi:Ni,Fe-hydrogenase maturation factor